ncbi:hypothetical protein [Nocardia camponoti]|uniref:Uncharacterized protein n=1 Tax=Nocardia camponoti TaxID=1616106 RepID=A0A917V4A5_9NOCA|nr:hypothetical protein [Nocardia camponoti]GGK35270.1 hypothetical protein GCM10011591_03670 [Nocardia camponoti]
MIVNRRTVSVFAACAAVAVTAACSSDKSGDHAAHSSTTTASTTTASTTATTAVKLTGTSAAPLPAPSPSHPPAPKPLADVNCGPVTGGNGGTADVIAFASDAGRPGCTEAFNVVTDYLTVPRTGDAATVDGWTCEPQPDTTVPHVCFKDGLMIGLRGNAAPANPPSPAPTPIRTIIPTSTPVTTTSSVPPEPAPVVDDVNCGPVTDAGGGTRTVIAVGTSAGRPGCTEAINVATTYVTTVSPSPSMTVDGWQCDAQADPTTPSVCKKDGLVIALRAS